MPDRELMSKDHESMADTQPKRTPRFLRQRAEREASWFFRVLGGQVPEDGDPATRAAAQQMAKWLRAISPFHRGVLSLRYVPRTWPTCIADEFGDLASVAVRLECALHPAVGISTEALEHASEERLEKAIQLCARARAHRSPAGRDRPNPADRGLAQLTRRASRHVALAIRALARVRGKAACLPPAAGAR
jgi:hypothetical protein